MEKQPKLNPLCKVHNPEQVASRIEALEKENRNLYESRAEILNLLAAVIEGVGGCLIVPKMALETTKGFGITYTPNPNDNSFELTIFEDKLTPEELEREA